MIVHDFSEIKKALEEREKQREAEKKAVQPMTVDCNGEPLTRNYDPYLEYLSAKQFQTD